MTWETIEPHVGTRIGNGGVTVAWRKTSARNKPLLAVTISAPVRHAMGLDRGMRVSAQRNRMTGKLRLEAGQTGWTPSFKSGGKTECACIYVPLEDVLLRDKKPAQAVAWEMDGAALVLTLPHWACPLIQVSGGARAIPLRDGRAA